MPVSVVACGHWPGVRLRLEKSARFS